MRIYSDLLKQYLDNYNYIRYRLYLNYCLYEIELKKDGDNYKIYKDITIKITKNNKIIKDGDKVALYDKNQHTFKNFNKFWNYIAYLKDYTYTELLKEIFKKKNRNILDKSNENLLIIKKTAYGEWIND